MDSQPEQKAEETTHGFLTQEEQRLGQGLLSLGWVQRPTEAPGELSRIRDQVAHFAADHLGLSSAEISSEESETFLREIHRLVSVAELNNLRLAVFRRLNAEPWFRPAYYRLARRALSTLVGNELAMQRRVNLSIQLPGDSSSLLPLHADSWSGDSPYEIVLWVPLVDCRRTQCMFLLPRPAQEKLLGDSDAVAAAGSVEDLFRLVEPQVQFLDISFGEVLLFDQNLLHGNRVNEEATARWSLNCRFKGLFTPYADKKLGEFFEPITVRPMSRLGMAHRFPSGFNDRD
ncbi:MAG: hypothetical protein K0U98_23890 [Deltaproteobacteria bacterium]|nr:hypothetical protein [Deltaproteobacteria bacterium]